MVIRVRVPAGVPLLTYEDFIMPIKTKKPRPKPKAKRGRPEKRLVIADPQAALDALLRKKPSS